MQRRPPTIHNWSWSRTTLRRTTAVNTPSPRETTQRHNISQATRPRPRGAAIRPPDSARASATGVVLVYRTPWVVARRCRLAAAFGGVCESYFYIIDIGDLPTPIVQQAPMLPIFDVRYVQRPNPRKDRERSRDSRKKMTILEITNCATSDALSCTQ